MVAWWLLGLLISPLFLNERFILGTGASSVVRRQVRRSVSTASTTPVLGASPSPQLIVAIADGEHESMADMHCEAGQRGPDSAGRHERVPSCIGKVSSCLLHHALVWKNSGSG